MTPAPLYEAQTNDYALLSFDGRVPEVFGRVDDARHHLRERWRPEFRPGRTRRSRIITKHGGRHSIPYDEHLLPGLHADHLARSLPPEVPKH
ncbi:hypothetical protein ACIRP2_11040 [Streptomyces sp. NPDC101194]|uniref:hypothetical protein n=1 Tax=Streptomyces sp. NPDC101194 TaxID=3366127 RepID=UPI003829E982